MPASLEPEPLAVSLALAYSGLQPDVKPLRGTSGLAAGAVAGASATYPRRGEEPGAMEYVAVTVRKQQERYLVLYQMTRYSTNDVTPMQWPNLRTAIASSQSWDARPIPASPPVLWPPSEFALPSVALELTDVAWAEAQAKAAEIVGPLTEDDTVGLVHLMVELVRNDDPPTLALDPHSVSLVARKVAMRAPTRLSTVLLRNIEAIETMHDLRAWAWQCLWAVGNRRDRS
jgi:hypothetical protein